MALGGPELRKLYSKRLHSSVYFAIRLLQQAVTALAIHMRWKLDNRAINILIPLARKADSL